MTDIDAGAAAQVAAALEAGSLHPLGRAIVAHAAQPPTVQATQLEETPGQSIAGMVDGQAYRLGNARHAAGLAGTLDAYNNGLTGPGHCSE